LFHRVGFVDVLVTEVYKDYLLGGHRCVPLAQVNAIFKPHVVFWVAPALLGIDKVVYKRVVVVITFDHYTV
jgi:hypothetical protein